MTTTLAPFNMSDRMSITKLFPFTYLSHLPYSFSTGSTKPAPWHITLHALVFQIKIQTS
jgi:hypothetical protein